MIEWFQSLGGLDKMFAVTALVGTLVFLVQLVLLLVGGDHGADADAAGMEVSHDVAHADSDVAFQFLSVQSITAAVMAFGYVGYSVHAAGGLAAPVALGGGAAAGFAAMWLVAKTFSVLRKMQSSGTLNLANAVGQTGRVYLGVKENEPGKVEVVVQGRLQVFDAVSEGGEALPTDTRVVVVRVESGNTMVVKRAEGAN